MIPRFLRFEQLSAHSSRDQRILLNQICKFHETLAAERRKRARVVKRMQAGETDGTFSPVLQSVGLIRFSRLQPRWAAIPILTEWGNRARLSEAPWFDG